jgi:hypothetical protein
VSVRNQEIGADIELAGKGSYLALFAVGVGSSLYGTYKMIRVGSPLQHATEIQLQRQGEKD